MVILAPRMKKIRIFLLRLFLLSVAITFVCGGRSYILSEKGSLCLPAGSQEDDLESPDCHYFSVPADNEKWFSSEEFHPGFFNIKPAGIFINTGADPRDFSNPVWQPPKA
jgi:hypothetical protein